MAVSLALNWSPPPSSPLFDDAGSSDGRNGEQQQQQSRSAGDLTSSPAAMSPATDNASRNAPPAPHHVPASGSGGSVHSLPRKPPPSLTDPAGTSPPQTRSYAAAAEGPQRSVSTPPAMMAPQLPPVGAFPGSFAAQLPGMPAFGQSPVVPGMGAAPQFGWTQYQQMLAAQARGIHLQQAAASSQSGSDTGSNSAAADDARRRRTTSGPQRPSKAMYNDAAHQQAYPGVSFANGAAPLFRAPYPGAMGPPALPSMNGQPGIVTAAPPSGGSYHPYRRQPRGSDASSSSPIQFGQGPTAPVLPALPGIAHPGLPRVRSSSTNSASQQEVMGAVQRGGAPAMSYSSVAAGSARPGPTSSQPSSSSTHLRNQSRSADPVAYPRPEPSQRSFSSASNHSTAQGADSLPSSSSHSRAGSFSSSVGSGTSTAGRTTPTPTVNGTTSRPSPLSQQRGRGADDDDDSRAVYGGSDDEGQGGRATPTQATEKKKSSGGGLNKLRKALSFSTLSDVQAAEAAAAAPDRAQGGRQLPRRGPAPPVSASAYANSSADTNGSLGSARSTSPPRTPDNGAPLPTSSAASISSKRSGRPPLSHSADSSAASTGGKRSLFMNRKFNSSTDNISISSTVSSASVMLRRVGQLGKLASRRSLSGLTNMFNKDKDIGGREGLHGDDFGAVGSAAGIGAAPGASADASGKAAKKGKSSKKGTPAAASVSHATVELEATTANGDAGMTPAASYVRQHQLQMKQQAEAEAKARQEAEAKAAAAAAASSKSRTKTTDDVMESRQKMIEREKEKLKSKRGLKKLFAGSSSSSSGANGGSGPGGADAAPSGLETMPSYLETQPATDSGPIPLPTHMAQGSISGGSYAGYAPPGASMAHHQAHGSYDHDAAFDAAFDQEELEPPQMPGARGAGESGDESETDSLRHWGEGIEQARASAANVKNVRGILKNSTVYNERGLPVGTGAGAFDKPFAGRTRANSYDAPQQAGNLSTGGGSAGGGIPLMNQLGSTPSDTDRVDGVAPRPASPNGAVDSSATSPRSAGSTQPPAPSPSAALGHHANSSMPTLSLMMQPKATVPQRSVTGVPMGKKRIAFAEQHIFHSTWPAHVYDRRGELATCNRLTPLLAQRIKEELNTYKMEEMAVAPSSRIHTHFFV